jgi:hypothetical protein
MNINQVRDAIRGLSNPEGINQYTKGGGDAFATADKKVHSVESQWHHPILTKHGFKAITPSAEGFVRSYRYEHPDGRVITAHTGVNSDYWVDQKTKKQGYWADLEPHVTTK